MNSMGRLGFFAIGAFVCAPTFHAAASAVPNASDHLRVVAISGNEAEGVNANLSYLGTGYINDQGDVSYSGYLHQGNGLPDLSHKGSWVESAGGTRLVVHNQGQPPGTASGTRFDVLAAPSLDAAGRVAFRATLVEGLAGVSVNNNSGIWSDASGMLQLVAREGGQAAGVPAGAKYGDFNPYIGLALNRSGQPAFRASLQVGAGGVTALNDAGIWAERNGGLELVVRANDLAPGAPAGARFEDLGEPDYNDLGQTAFRGTLQFGLGGVTSADDLGIWSEGDGSLQLVARSGFAAPGVAAPFYGLAGPVINNRGDTAFGGWVKSGGGGDPVVIRGGIWTGGSSDLRLVALQGNAAPGAGPGAEFADIYFTPALSDQGATAFYADLKVGTGGVTAANDMGLWRDVAGDLQLIARKGDVAPGAPVGSTFNGFLNAPLINDRGQVLFHALALLPSGEERVGVWAHDRNDQLQLVALPETLIDVAEGPAEDWRVLGSANVSDSLSGPLGAFNGFNNEGQIVFAASFRDGTSAIIVSDVATIPEPSAAGLATTATLGQLLRKRGRSRGK